MFVAGVDGCRAGWICFKYDTSSHATTVDVIDLPSMLKSRPSDLPCLGIDIPIGLLDAPRACDMAARKLLGQSRGSSVFPTPCRAAVQATSYEEASAINRLKTGRGLSRQAWGIAPKIRHVDDAITPDCQQWAFEVHPEVCFWALNEGMPMKHNKKCKEGRAERLNLLFGIFPRMEEHLERPMSGVGADDLLDAAVAAWTAIRWLHGTVKCVCEPKYDHKGLGADIYY